MIRRGVHRPIRRTSPTGPPRRVSVVLVSRETNQEITKRVDDLRSGDYPPALLDVVVSLDASVASRASDLQGLLGDRATVVCGNERGKASALNAGVSASKADLLLFVDSAQYFERDTISELVGEFDERVWGALTATLAATSGDVIMDRYWQRELAIRQGQESRHSIICVTGCAYVMHRRFWRPMPAGLICDDLWSTYGVVTQGGRVGIVASARVTDPRRFTREQEYARRLRTMTGLLQFLRTSPEVLNPSRNPMCLDFLLHKLMRPATPLLVMLSAACFTAAVWLWSPRAVLAAAFVAVATTLGGLLLAFLAPKWLAPKLATIVFARRLMFMPLRAISRAMRSDWDVWTTMKP